MKRKLFIFILLCISIVTCCIEPTEPKILVVGEIEKIDAEGKHITIFITPEQGIIDYEVEKEGEFYTIRLKTNGFVHVWNNVVRYDLRFEKMEDE